MVDSSITKGPCKIAICWVLWTHICQIGFMYTLANNTEKERKKKKTSAHEEGEGERGGVGGIFVNTVYSCPYPCSYSVTHTKP